VLGCGADAPPQPSTELDPAQAEAQAEALAAQRAARQAAEDRAAQLPGAQLPGTGTGTGPGGVQAGEAQVIDASARDAAPVQVVLVWEGIGNLHKGFFSDPVATTALSTDLAGTVQAPANIYVRYDSKAFVGSVRLQLRPDTLRLAVHSQDDLVDLQGLAPITQALASYRSDVAARFDVRIQSFSVGIESFRGATGCLFGVGGAPPPDGRLVSPCVEVNGQEHCGEPTLQGVRFPPEVARAVRTCLDL